MRNIVIVLGIIVFCLFGYIAHQSNTIKGLSDKNSVLKANEKAYVNATKVWKDESDRHVAESRTFQKTIADQKYENDKITKQQNKLIKDLNLDIKRLKQVGYISTKIDTVLVPTEITKDSCYKFEYGPQMKASFCIKNKQAFYKPQISNDVSIFFTDKRETVDPPKKFFIARWFQKKHTIVNATAINSNKFVSTDTLRVTYIIK